MFQYFSRFLIQILPSVTATVIGGFIVHTWIMPKTASDAPRPAIASKAAPEAGANADTRAESKPLNVKGIAMPVKDGAVKDAAAKDSAPKAGPAKETASVKAAGESDGKAGEVKLRGASETPAAEPRHAAKPVSTDRAAATDTPGSIDKPAGSSNDTAKTVGAPALTATATEPADEKRNATDLARTALERLRSGEQPRTGHALATEATSPAARTQAVELHRIQPQPGTEPVQLVTPQPVALPMGPPINIATPRYSDSHIGNGEREDDARVVPPGEIPTMHRTADSQDGRTTIADDFVSATRSMLRAVLPK